MKRQLRPEVGVAEWLHFGRAMMRTRKWGRQGIVTVRYPGQRFPCGMVHYSLGHDPGYGRALIADHMVAMDLLHPATIVEALLEELEALRSRLRCQAVRVIVRNEAEGPTLNPSLRGFRHEGAILRKAPRDRTRPELTAMGDRTVGGPPIRQP